MKYSKRYIVCAVLLTAALFLKFQILGMESGKVSPFRGGNLKESIWNPLVANDVNDSILKLVIDNREYTNEGIPFFMNEDRNIMVPVSMLRDSLNCSVHVYEDRELLVEKHSSRVSFVLDEKKAFVEDEEVSVVSGFAKRSGDYYVSLNDLSQLLGYNCTFDIQNRTMTAADAIESTTIVPARYDLREKKRVSQIRNQGQYGTCWAFAASSAMESSLLPEESVLFSVDHMSMSNSFNLNQFEGGEYTMGMAYLAAWQGPVYESDDPYGDGVSDSSLQPVRHVQEMQVIDGKDYLGIKNAVFKYGGVQTSLYSTLKSSQGSSKFYNKENKAYCYIGTEKPNHDVVIIGWDDNYPKENFSVPLEENGAFICQNSWGTDFGEDGIFYVSYYDTNIGTHNVVYTRIDEVDNYDHIYQSDLCGWVGKMGYDKEEIYGANVYTAGSPQSVVAAAFYATAANTEYEVYIVKNFVSEGSFAQRIKVASGRMAQAGYYTVDFDTPVAVEEGERFAVLLYVKTPENSHPMAIEYDPGDKALEYVDLEDGEGYISANGVNFVNVKSKEECNLCIKAFTDERS